MSLMLYPDTAFWGHRGVNQYKSLEKALAVLKENGLEMVAEYFDMDKFMDIGCYVIISPLLVVNVRTRSVTMEGRFVKRKKAGPDSCGLAGSMRAVTG
ncbi:hypothetical protein [Enterocloster sp.]|uniref:hypothetical protein n=1 Tax=Enterocloster sp. TaxID=2719315 RepID=UPI0039A02735